MMKRVLAALLLLVTIVSLTACGAKSADPVVIDLDALWGSLKKDLPEMMEMPPRMQEMQMGISAEDCEKSLVYICETSEEVWLIQAKDADALKRLQALADTRLKIKAEETENYAPEEYKLVKKGKVLTRDLYLALFVAADSEAMKAAFEAAK